MDLADLTLTQWRSIETSAARRLAAQIAEKVGGRVSTVQSTEHAGAPLHQALIKRDGCLFALVPGGTTIVGYDVERWADQTPQALAERGLRMPSPDEWEHACAAGATTLWRWAEDCPLDRSPYGYLEGPQNQPNAFGLHIAHEVYDAELTSDPAVIRGGDGGEAVCGGYGSFVEWLPLATSNRNPNMAEFIHGPDGEDMYEGFHVRPVIEI